MERKTMGSTVVGIDVGGEKKGFHAVSFNNDKFLGKMKNPNPDAMVAWFLELNPSVIAIDTPCGWSNNGSSRLAEREMSKRGIWSFSSPTKQKALQSNFYKWMLNGEKLYECLESHRYPRFNGGRTNGPMCIETFPHAIMCAIAGRVVPAKPKVKRR